AADRGDWLAGLAERTKDRRPVIPAWLRSRQDAGDAVRWVARHYAHVVAYHTVRVPLYAGRLALRAPHGLARLGGGLVRWTFDLEGLPVRMATVKAADPEAYLKLSRQRDARVRVRIWPAGLVVLAAAGSALWLACGVSGLTQAAVCAGAVGVFGWLGRPADRPLIEHAITP